MEKLTDNEIQNKLVNIDQAWIIRDGFLHREFGFKDFVQAFSFMTAVSLRAEKFAHHPNWTNVYNKVIIDLSTHDAGGITMKDFELAMAIDAIL
jgi:4a-hydroxytetrahydrobiopterin dehydratase